MALIDNISDFNKFVTVSSDFDSSKLLKYAQKAERKVIRMIGKSKFTEIENAPFEDETRQLLCEYVANQGLYLGLSGFVLNITGFGVFTNATSDAVRAEWWQVRDLKRDLAQFSFTALDEALELIGVENNDLLKDLWVTSTAQFNKVYNINNSTQTFLALLPFIREAQDEFLSSTLGNCANHSFTEAQKELIRAALVNLAVSKAATSGAFSFDSNAMLLRIEVLPWEKVEKIEQSAIEKFQSDRFNIAMGYLNQISKLVKELPCYQPTPIKSEILKKDSGLFL